MGSFTIPELYDAAGLGSGRSDFNVKAFRLEGIGVLI